MRIFIIFLLFALFGIQQPIAETKIPLSPFFCSQNFRAPLVSRATPNSIVGTLSKFKVHTGSESGYFKKLSMINSAKSGDSLDLAYFIIESDYSSSYLISKIIAASKRGVKVRILVDYFMSFGNIKTLELLNSTENITVKLFRPATDRFRQFLTTELEMSRPDSFLVGIASQNKDLILDGIASSPELAKLMGPIQAQLSNSSGMANMSAAETTQLQGQMIFALMAYQKHKGKVDRLKRFLRNYMRRLHHKILLVRHENYSEFIIGGRNISDEYHIGLAELNSENRGLLNGRNYPFIDSEVSGRLRPSAQESSVDATFDRLWNGHDGLYAQVNTVSPLIYSERMVDIKKNTAEFKKHISRLRKRVKSGTINGGEKIGAKYVENLYHKDFAVKEISTTWAQLIESAKPGQKVEIVTAYLFLYPQIMKSLSKAVKNGIDVDLYTNSFATTDLNMINLAAYQNLRGWLEELKGDGAVKFFELNLEKGRGSLHAKIIKVGDVVGIGSANMDPRSFLGDTNNALFIDFSKRQGMAQQIFDKYLQVPGQIPWRPLTVEQAEMFLKHAMQDNKGKATLKIVNDSYVQDQL